MLLFLATFVIALAFSCMGFKKYVWFISIGYGFSVAAIGIGLLVAAHDQLTAATAIACVLFIVYGLRLGGYLAFRELRSTSYNTKMKGEIKSGDDMSMVAKCAIWISAALLYACETSPVCFRLANESGADALLVIGLIVSVIGLVVETVADLQKNAAKKANPRRFVDTGLFSIVRCPNYFGEITFWTGVFVSGFTTYQGIGQWLFGIIGYVAIFYIMINGAQRLDRRQEKANGHKKEYRAYADHTPLILPFIPVSHIGKYKD